MTEDQEYIALRPELTVTGVAIWSDGQFFMPICGSKECLKDIGSFCVVMEHNDWICTQCGRPHGITGTDRSDVRLVDPDVRTQVAAWVGVSAENITIEC